MALAFAKKWHESASRKIDNLKNAEDKHDADIVVGLLRDNIVQWAEELKDSSERAGTHI